ncbi:MAG: NAD(P)-dependent oxidoreductase [Anaerolinea sp.]|nr:NAD(P)-dependent oxidoreductase [Anaerolinea sp.]
MNLELAKKIAFVTGASSGIGAAVARVLSEEGADVVVSFGHDETGARETLRAVEANGRQSWLSQMDISDPHSITSSVEQLKKIVNHIDIFILCAGQNIVTPWAEITPEEWNQVIGVNLGGAFFTLQALVPLMSEGGSIVTVASVAGQTGTPNHVHYAAAKAGLINLTKSLAKDLAPRIRVNCVSPGITITPMGEDTIACLVPDYAEKKIPVQRYASADEIARTIVFVASPVAGFMTGATIDINGGREMR